MKIKIVIFFFLFLSLQGAGQQTKTGIEVLQLKGFDILKGKRVGLITNPTGVNSQLKSTVDILHEAKDVQLVALFGPEHGVRGNFSAGDEIEGSVDPKTQIPVFSLYGKTRKATPEMLSGIDVLVYDIQDIGARSYTYISTLGLAMEAAAENNVDFVVLDRPNPLGGNRVEGPLVEKEFVSFVSQYPVPYIYGLTPGELATCLNEEGLLKNGIKCNLHVVKMKNWKRHMVFPQTGLPWVPASPHIPRDNSAFFYSATGIMGELDANSIGVGYTLPFEVFATSWLDADALAKKMNQLKMKGVIFRPVSFKPYYMKNKGKEHSGVQIHITDFEKVKLTEMQFLLVQAAHELVPDSNLFRMNPGRWDMFDKVCGNKRIREKFTENYRYSDIQEEWEKPAAEFAIKKKRYHLY
ncbi:MAG: DUF1343 domain-containing protein [Prolixibacteraceae bacterium]|jgi:uncharacterized protein YbbC (DUF1343 family)|nr:DUF1343 domain-containing protein [Prolixibacteraceae bacterium]